MIESRVRAGHYERRCTRSGVWYWKLASHVHEYHRASCRCLKICAPLITAGKKIMPRK